MRQQNTGFGHKLGTFLVGLVVVLGCVGGAAYMYYDKMRNDQSTVDRPAGSKDARYANVGDCLVKAPTEESPGRMEIGDCTAPGAYKVVEVHRSGAKDCEKGDTVYTVSGSSAYKVCLDQLKQ